MSNRRSIKAGASASAGRARAKSVTRGKGEESVSCVSALSRARLTRVLAERLLRRVNGIRY